jgi:hypothetical protein
MTAVGEFSHPAVTVLSAPEGRLLPAPIVRVVGERSGHETLVC